MALHTRLRCVRVTPGWLRALSYAGRLAVGGSVVGGFAASLELGALHEKRLQIFGASNRLRSPAAKAETVAGFQRDWLPAFADGRLRPLIDSVFPMEQLDVAIAKMEQNQHLSLIHI